MLITVLAFLAALQSQTPAPNVQVAALTPPPPASAPTSAPAPAPVEAPAEAAAPEPEAEPVEAAPRTREVCRFVDAPGRRFPIRRCRTIEVDD